MTSIGNSFKEILLIESFFKTCILYSFWEASLQEIEALLYNNNAFATSNFDVITDSTVTEDVFSTSLSQQDENKATVTGGVVSELVGSRMKYALNF